jgi:hypothetical protein
MQVEEIWVGEPMAAYADRLADRYQVPVTVVPTRPGMTPLASIIDTVTVSGGRSVVTGMPMLGRCGAP